MNPLFRFLFVFGLLAVISTASAQVLSPEQAKALEKKFLRFQQASRTMQVDFRQTLSSHGLQYPVVSEGKVYFRAPGDLCVSYTRPEGDYYLLSGEQMKVSKRGKPARIIPLSQPAAKPFVAMRDFLRGAHTQEEKQFKRTVERVGEEYVVTLEPNLPSPVLPKLIENRLDAATQMLKSMQITMPSGTAMKFEFSNPVRNQQVDPSIFAAK